MKSLDGDIENIKNIIEDKHEISNLIKEAKKPINYFWRISSKN